MRQIGTLPTKAGAERFSAYLITRGIESSTEEEDGGWEIWVRDEDQLEDAVHQLEVFRSNPDDARYRGVVREANALREAAARRREKAQKQQIRVSDEWSRPSARRTPLVTSVILTAVLLFLLTDGGGAALKFKYSLTFCNIGLSEARGDYETTAQRLTDIRRGQIWRLVTPVLLHGGILHLVFNLLWLYQLGTPIEQRKGARRLGLIMLAVAVISTTIQALAPSDWGPFSGGPYVVGMSGVVFGLLGYLWIKGTADPEDGLGVPQGTLMFMLFWLFLGFSGILDNLLGASVANLAHGAGLLVGMAIGQLDASVRQSRG